MSGQHRRADGHRGAELVVHEVEADVEETASWVQRNPTTLAYLWHLLLASGVVGVWVNAHSEQLRLTLTALAVLLSGLAHIAGTDRTTPIADPRLDDGTPLVPDVSGSDDPGTEQEAAAPSAPRAPAPPAAPRG